MNTTIVVTLIICITIITITALICNCSGYKREYMNIQDTTTKQLSVIDGNISYILNNIWDKFEEIKSLIVDKNE